MGVYYVVREGIPRIWESVSGKDTNGHGKSGSQSVSFWELKIGKIMEDKLAVIIKPSFEVQNDILKDIRDSIKDQNKLFQDLILERLTNAALTFGDRGRNREDS